MWQWVRHRTWNMNAQSGRYTPFEEDAMYIPAMDAWRKQSSSNKQASSGEMFTLEEQEAIINGLYANAQSMPTLELAKVSGDIFSDLLEAYFASGFEIYQTLLDNGAAKEQARLFLPGWGLYYTWVAKIDAHNLMNFLRLRMDSHAQYEIRVYAECIYENIFKAALPATAAAFEEYVLNAASKP